MATSADEIIRDVSMEKDDISTKTFDERKKVFAQTFSEMQSKRDTERESAALLEEHKKTKKHVIELEAILMEKDQTLARINSARMEAEQLKNKAEEDLLRFQMVCSSGSTISDPSTDCKLGNSRPKNE